MQAPSIHCQSNFRGAMAKRPTRRKQPSRAKPLPRPSKWYREPLSKRDLMLIDEREQPTYIAQERILRLEKLKEKIRTLRRYSNAFGSKNGIDLTTRKLVRIPESTYRRINREADKLSRATSRPFVTVVPRTKQQRVSTTREAGKLIEGQTRFIIHTESASRVRATFQQGQLKLIETVKGGEITEVRYFFKRKPRSWNDVKKFTAELQRKGMKTGNYKLVNNLYGDIGRPMSREKLQEGLEDYYGTYNRFMAGTILGWRWYGTSLDSTLKKEAKIKRVETRFKEVRAYQKYKEDRRLLEIAQGKKVRPCRYCKKKKCQCKSPEFE